MNDKRIGRVCSLNRMLFDLERKGLLTIFKPYQVRAMRYLWGHSGQSEGKNSGEVFRHVNENPSTKISRASIIFFLNYMVDKGYLWFWNETGKGGYHRVYATSDTEEDFKQKFSVRIIEKLITELGYDGSGLEGLRSE